MRSKFALVAGIVVMGVIGAVLPAWAHHAHGNYATELVDFEGVVTEIHALNPHGWIYVTRKEADGQEQTWALEAGGAVGLRKLQALGVVVKVGEKVKIRCHALRDGSAGCLLGYIKSSNGDVYDYDSQAETPKPVVLPGF